MPRPRQGGIRRGTVADEALAGEGPDRLGPAHRRPGRRKRRHPYRARCGSRPAVCARRRAGHQEDPGQPHFQRHQVQSSERRDPHRRQTYRWQGIGVDRAGQRNRHCD